MRISINVKALGAFKKLGAVALITATIFFVACNQTGGGGGGKPKHAITFNVDGANGKLTAKVDGGDIASGKEVEEGKAVIFTATADAGYRVKGWTLDGNAVNGTAETYTLAVTKTTTVSVSFEVASVEGGAVLILSQDNLTINVEAKTEDGSAITVEGCTVSTLASGTKTTLTATGTKVILKGNITELYCFDNKLTELNVQGLTTLKLLNCRNNQLTALNVQGCTALQGLYCYGNNKLTALNVQGLTALQLLNCHTNELTELNVQGLTALQGLSCEGNKLTALNVQGLTALQVLNCHNNKLTELNVQGLTALQELDCRKNQLTELNLQGLTSLQGLWCTNNQLTALNIQGCTALKYMWFHSNQLNAQAMTEILKALPSREASAKAVLYTEETGETEGNHKDFSQPADLKKAFEDAKSRNWELKKNDESGREVDI